MTRCDLPETTARLAEIINRAWLAIDANPRAYDAATYAAVRVLADSEIAAGLRDTRLLAELGPRLAVLDARHQPREWAASSTGYVCTAGCGAHPCETRRTLDGELVAA